MEQTHTILGYVLTGWLALNAGVIFGAWWATRGEAYDR